ncbi:hypothetical protein TNCV_2754621 [Trichonephila clavipes]|nr:hypothetical protein TNCV_2754621 [Trichonephila clavipes]
MSKTRLIGDLSGQGRVLMAPKQSRDMHVWMVSTYRWPVKDVWRMTRYHLLSYEIAPLTVTLGIMDVCLCKTKAD